MAREILEVRGQKQEMCMMSQRQTIIFNAFFFYSLEYAGAQGSVTVAFPVLLLTFLPKNIKNMGDGRKGLLDAFLALFLLLTLILFFPIVTYTVP